MRRRAFDRLVSTEGMVLVPVLAVAGGLLTWPSDCPSVDLLAGSVAQRQTAMVRQLRPCRPTVG